MLGEHDSTDPLVFSLRLETLNISLPGHLIMKLLCMFFHHQLLELIIYVNTFLTSNVITACRVLLFTIFAKYDFTQWLRSARWALGYASS